MTNDDKDTGFISHLAELRKRLIHSFIFLIIFFDEKEMLNVLFSSNILKRNHKLSFL